MTERKVKVFRPWQLKQWLSPPVKDGKPWVPESDKSRQRIRQGFLAVSIKSVNENYGQESRRARRMIARKLAKRAFRQYRQAA